MVDANVMKNSGSYESDINMYGMHKLDKIAVNRSRNEFGLSVGITKEKTIEKEDKRHVEIQVSLAQK